MTQLLLLIFALFSALVTAISLYWNNLTIKFVSITLLVILANCVYFSLDGVKGWPSEESSEIKGVLASVVIVNPTSESEGAIYVGLFPTIPHKWYEYVYHRQAPKTFFIKYSNDRASKFEEAKQAMSEGKQVRINGIPPENFTGDSDNFDGNEDGISGMISNLIKKIIPKQKDTYRPEIPDVEIITPEFPEKGTEQ